MAWPSPSFGNSNSGAPWGCCCCWLDCVGKHSSPVVVVVGVEADKQRAGLRRRHEVCLCWAEGNLGSIWEGGHCIDILWGDGGEKQFLSAANRPAGSFVRPPCQLCRTWAQFLVSSHPFGFITLQRIHYGAVPWGKEHTFDEKGHGQLTDWRRWKEQNWAGRSSTTGADEPRSFFARESI